MRRSSSFGVLLEDMIQVIILGHPIAWAKRAVASRLGRPARNVASSFRNSAGKLMTAGFTLSSDSSFLVASTPSFIAASTFTSTPGKPTLAARRAKSGHFTRPPTRTSFRARYIELAAPKTPDETSDREVAPAAARPAD